MKKDLIITGLVFAALAAFILLPRLFEDERESLSRKYTECRVALGIRQDFKKYCDAMESSFNQQLNNMQGNHRFEYWVKIADYRLITNEQALAKQACFRAINDVSQQPPSPLFYKGKRVRIWCDDLLENKPLQAFYDLPD